MMSSPFLKAVRETVAQSKDIFTYLFGQHCRNPCLHLTFLQFPLYLGGNSNYSFLIVQ